jgi:hypothetical protein
MVLKLSLSSTTQSLFRSELKQQLYSVGMSSALGPVQGSQALTIPGVDIGALGKKHSYGFAVPFQGCIMKRRPITPTYCVNIRSSGNKQLYNFTAACRGCAM